jgi:hypothetical protein
MTVTARARVIRVQPLFIIRLVFFAEAPIRHDTTMSGSSTAIALGY